MLLHGRSFPFTCGEALQYPDSVNLIIGLLRLYCKPALFETSAQNHNQDTICLISCYGGGAGFIPSSPSGPALLFCRPPQQDSASLSQAADAFFDQDVEDTLQIEGLEIREIPLIPSILWELIEEANQKSLRQIPRVVNAAANTLLSL